MINGDTSRAGRTFRCPQCETDCVIEANSLDDFIVFENKYYHKMVEAGCSCGHNHEHEHEHHHHGLLGKLKEALEQYPKLEEESKQRLTDLYIQDALYCFLLRYYSLTVIPVFFWKKLADLTNGRYPNVSVAITYKHIYDMWRRRANYLNKLADTNKTKGKEMTGEQRLHYDLAVLINQYDSYLRFLEREKIKEATEEVHKPVVSSMIARPQKVQNDDNDNIDALVDEVFGA